MDKVRFALAVLAIVIVGLLIDNCQIGRADADHNIWLPLIPNTPLLQDFRADGQMTYCLDSRASSYPGFANQVEAVNAAYHSITGIPFQRVAWGTPFTTGCEIQHNMPDSFDCGGCAANVFYANWPTAIQYKWQLGYVSWETTIGHELGHDVLGLHEQYYDSGGGISCKSLADLIRLGPGPTVMSCGTGIKYPTAWDRDRGWEISLPKPVREAGIDLSVSPPRLYYCGADVKADRVAVMARAPWGEDFWTGNHLPVSGGCVGLPLYSEPGWEFLFNVEIGAWQESWLRWEMRNDASAGVMP